jgi:hypothetical protein
MIEFCEAIQKHPCFRDHTSVDIKNFILDNAICPRLLGETEHIVKFIDRHVSTKYKRMSVLVAFMLGRLLTTFQDNSLESNSIQEKRNTDNKEWHEFCYYSPVD